MSGSSFVKMGGGRHGRLPQIPGTKPSLRTSQLVTSSGHASIDAILGGGIPMGSLLLIEEDSMDNVANILFRYYLAEGVASSQPIMVVTDGALDEASILANIPRLSKPSEDATAETSSIASSGPEMTIAWRYENLAAISPSVRSATGSGQEIRSYNLSKSVDQATLKALDICIIDLSDNLTKPTTDASGDSMRDYSNILSKLAVKISEEQFNVKTDRGPQKPALLRICIRGLGSPLWPGCNTNFDSQKYHLSILQSLKCLVRHAYAVALIMVSPQFLNSTLLRRIRHACDSRIELESFLGSAKLKNPLYTDYDGLLKITKVPVVNSLAPHIPDSEEYGYKVKVRKLQIDRLHLPPDLTETASRTSQLGQGSCSAGLQKAKLDF